MEELEQKLIAIKKWLDTGSINIFGLPMSGKDTIGIRFAELIGGKFLSSGLILRAQEKANGNNNLTGSGVLTPSNIFFDVVLPYFKTPELSNFPLVLSSVGRWSGEEEKVMAAAAESGHPIKAAVLLNISEGAVFSRWEAARLIQDRNDRVDDKSPEVFQRRLDEFREKTIPVIRSYQDLGLLVEVHADQSRDEAFAEFVNAIYAFSLKH